MTATRESETSKATTPASSQSTGAGSGTSASSGSSGSGTSGGSGRDAVRALPYAEGAAYLSPGAGDARNAPDGAEPKGGGAGGLPGPLNAKMSAAFGADLSGVRVHEDGQADAVGAKAFTRGDDVHFAQGAYAPESASGQALIGHELTHVVQQRAGRVGTGTGGAREQVAQAKATEAGVHGKVNNDPGLEAEADVLGAAAARGERVQVGGSGAGGGGGAADAGPSGDAHDAPIQGVLPVITGLAGIGARGLARDGAIRMAKHAAIELIRAQLPELQAQATEAARLAVLNSPEIKLAMKQLGDLGKARAFVDALVEPVAAKIAGFMSERASAFGAAVADIMPDLGPIVPESIRSGIAAVSGSIRAVLPTGLMDSARELLSEVGSAALTSVVSSTLRAGIDKVSGMAATKIARTGVEGAMEAGKAAIGTVTERGEAILREAGDTVEKVSEVLDMVPGIPGTKMLEKGVAKVAKHAVPHTEVSSMAGEMAEATKAPNQALLAEGEKMQGELSKRGFAENAATLAKLMQAYTIAKDVTEAEDAEAGLGAVFSAISSALGVAGGAMVAKNLAPGGGAGGMAVSAGAGAAITGALNMALKRAGVASALARAGRSAGSGDGIASGAVRAGYVGGKAVVDTARLPVKAVGVAWGAIKSVFTLDGKHARGAAKELGGAWNELMNTPESARANMDPKNWQGEAPGRESWRAKIPPPLTMRDVALQTALAHPGMEPKAAAALARKRVMASRLRYQRAVQAQQARLAAERGASPGPGPSGPGPGPSGGGGGGDGPQLESSAPSPEATPVTPSAPQEAPGPRPESKRPLEPEAPSGIRAEGATPREGGEAEAEAPGEKSEAPTPEDKPIHIDLSAVTAVFDSWERKVGAALLGGGTPSVGPDGATSSGTGGSPDSLASTPSGGAEPLAPTPGNTPDRKTRGLPMPYPGLFPGLAPRGMGGGMGRMGLGGGMRGGAMARIGGGPLSGMGAMGVVMRPMPTIGDHMRGPLSSAMTGLGGPLGAPQAPAPGPWMAPGIGGPMGGPGAMVGTGGTGGTPVTPGSPGASDVDADEPVMEEVD